jgi:hypothetical protein
MIGGWYGSSLAGTPPKGGIKTKDAGAFPTKERGRGMEIGIKGEYDEC